MRQGGQNIKTSPLSHARKLLLRQEGLKLKPYLDSEGVLTIGVGRNLDDVGISEQEALHLFANDLVRFWRELSEAFTWFDHLLEGRQLALLSMAFSLGMPRLRTFKRMLAAMETGDFEVAALQVLDSKWATQVKRRAREVAQMLKTGELPHDLK